MSNKTVAINEIHDNVLRQLAKKSGVSKKDYLEQLILYAKNRKMSYNDLLAPIGFTPEDEKIIKRIDQLFAFLKKQEKDFIKPMVSDVSEIKEDNLKIRSGVIGLWKEARNFWTTGEFKKLTK